MLGTILVVDDEETLRGIVRNYLEQEGYAVLEANDGAGALAVLRRSAVDLVLLDWMMPGMSGLEVCRKLREFSEVPVIFLTAKTEELDKLLGLELGADDYITKPFSMRELAARIRVVLRRLQRAQGEAVPLPEKNEQLVRGRLTVDLARHAALLDGVPVTLTPTEFKLLVTLAASPGRVYSRLQLLEIALGEEYAGYERSIDTHISNLRKKLERDPGQPELIVTVFGVGYKFGEPT
ncbi:DNA-binding response OmpR family regulator [Tumebacillus sp. BK434]|uniref:response regulator transcription factor n=1 Tax=Tumebacillus sp. BK434 TaxID=2512169 RepID=UPI001047352C|nr:response regulator transcription factor [Tumebacillus sp. BK434]TCP58260.1 DNA-binding response OmpR family regulator [Tumebacillus sp. BK434]